MRIIEPNLIAQNTNVRSSPNFSWIICYCKRNLSLLRMQTHVLSHFNPHFWFISRMFQPTRYQTIVDVCRIGTIARISDMKNNDQSSILMLKEIKRDKEILNSPSDETKLPMVLFTCFFLTSFFSFIQNVFKLPLTSITLWHSYISFRYKSFQFTNVNFSIFTSMS